ncbi:MAG: cyclase family protein [Desulfobacterales bacterium]|nr:MAG: cyclase family protein [Desulfobacterales bacterium]
MSSARANQSRIDLLVELMRGFECVDLPPTIETGMPRWPTHPVVVVNPSITHAHDGYYCQTLLMGEHTGSHVDAPAHILPDRMDRTIDTFPPNYLMAPAKVTSLVHRDFKPGELLKTDDLAAWEKEWHLSLDEGEVALLDFGWHRRYWRSDREWAWYALNSPGFDESACEFLANRKLRAIGVDTIACDEAVVDGRSSGTPGHREYFLPNDILVMECLANLEKLNPTCFFVALPLKIKNGSGSPLRAVAFQEKR